MMVLKVFLLLCTLIVNLAFAFSSHSTMHHHHHHHSNNIINYNRQLQALSLSSIKNENWSKVRGGGDIVVGKAASKDCPFRKVANNLISIWACEGFVLMLVNSIRRLVPKALEPFNGSSVPLTTFQLGAYISTCLFFAYAEGYKGFQRKFAPMVVARSFTISLSKIHHIILGPLYSMGLIHATKKRKIVSWSLAFGIFALIAAVKRLPYPYKNIIDAGVVVGLSWGAASIQIAFLKALFTRKIPDVDPQLPSSS